MTTEYDSGMTEWHEDAGLAVLVAQEKKAHPGMVVGEIAGGGHSTTHTDHVPDPTDKADPHGVDAADFMIGSAFTKSDAQELADALQRGRDERIAYVIYNRRIMSSTIAPWTWRPYTGSDPHTGHVHVSVNDAHHSNLKEWKLTMADATLSAATKDDIASRTVAALGTKDGVFRSPSWRSETQQPNTEWPFEDVFTYAMEDTHAQLAAIQLDQAFIKTQLAVIMSTLADMNPAGLAKPAPSE